jgi:hypothetical protein
MAILNAGLSFAAAPQEVRKMFWGIPEVVLFHAKTDLYRLLTPRGMHYGVVENESAVDPFSFGNKVISDCWFDQEGLATLVRSAHDTDLPISTVARYGFAVKYKWNPTMEDLAIVRLQCEALGLRGPTNRRYLDPLLSGPGIPQIWLPNLSAGDVLVLGKTNAQNLIPSFEGLGGGPVLRQP